MKGLKIDAYIEMANKSIEKICEEIKKKDGIIDVILVHFQGDFSLSENLVYVVVASSHRGEGFTALRETVEKYKKEIAVWKKEDFIAVAKKVIEALGNLPKEICICSSYVHETGAWCVYESNSDKAAEQIKDFLTKSVPNMKTEVTPVLQFFPPAQDIYSLMHKIIEITTQ